MQPFFLRPTLLLLPLALAACSGTPSKKDCETADYYEMGVDDGKDGEPGATLAQYKEQCPKEGIAVDEAKYDYGRKVGLAEYCDEDRGQSDAEDLDKDPVCIKEKVPPYQVGYLNQLDEERAKTNEKMKEIQEDKAELQSKENELQSEINQMDQRKAAVESGSL